MLMKFNCGTIFLVFGIGLASAQYPGAAPGVPGAAGMPDMNAQKIQQVELTEKSAKGAVDAYLELKEKYGDDTPGTNPKKNTAEAFEQLEGVESVVKEHGFNDTSDWHTAMTSVAIAYGFAKDDKRAEMDESMAKIKDNPQIPDGLKQQLMGMMRDLRPSDNNIAVLNQLIADPEYGRKLAETR